MKYSIVINQFERLRFVDRAIQSCQSLSKHPDDTVEIIVVSDVEMNRYGGQIKNIVIPESPIGYRYAQGLKVATGDWIFLLDDDDHFLPDKLQRYRNVPAGIQMIKEYSGPHIGIPGQKETWKKWMKKVIKYHVDWHTSQYCFNQAFKDKLFANDIESVSVSFDKYLFAIAMYDVNGLLLLNKTRTVKVEHSDSRMHSMRAEQKRSFYEKTVEMISHVRIASPYKDYTYDLNAFLSSGDRKYFSHIKNYLPMMNRLYYEHLWKPYAVIKSMETAKGVGK